MSGIVVLFADNGGLNNEIPVKYIIGAVPQLINGEDVPDGSAVAKIKFREHGTAFGQRVQGGVFVVSFDGSTIENYIPVHAVTNVLYETKKADEVQTPPLEE